MNSIEKGFKEVSNYIKKFKGAIQVVQAKLLAKKSHNVGNFNGYY